MNEKGSNLFIWTYYLISILVMPLISILFEHIHECFRQNPNKQYKYCLNHMDIPWHQLRKKLIWFAQIHWLEL